MPAATSPSPETRRRRARGLRWLVALATVAGLAALALWPTRVRVDSATVATGMVRDTLEAEGRTRVHERYLLTAPLAGTVRRQTLAPGDAVRAGDVLVTLDALASPVLDARSRAQAQAQAAAAQAQWQAAQAEQGLAEQAAQLARSEARRIQQLVAQGMLSTAAGEQAASAQQQADWAVQGARFRAATAAHQLAAAQALLRHSGTAGAGAGTLVLRAPVAGVVLQRHGESARTVQAGEPLLELGDPTALEVVVDVLSADAARLRPGLPVLLERWGDGPALSGQVRRIEPAAFTKVSALGVEEQRVWVVVDLLSPPAERPTLGEAYRVQARFVLRQVDDALWVPSGAVFRDPRQDGDGRAVFRIDGDRARWQAITIGVQGEGRTQVLQGLQAGERVVLHPPRDLADGQRVTLP